MRRGLVVSMVLLLAGCGGGGGPSEVTLVLKPLAGLSGGVDGAGGVHLTDGVAVGDDPSNVGYRINQSFSLAGIPAGAEVLSAVYRNEQVEVVGAPYATLGVVQLISGTPGAALGPEDYAPPTLQVIHGVLSDSASLGVKTLDVTHAVQLDLLNDPELRLDVQVKFNTEDDGDGAFDQAVFWGPAQAGDVPALVVRYRP